MCGLEQDGTLKLARMLPMKMTEMGKGKELAEYSSTLPVATYISYPPQHCHWGRKGWAKK